MFKLDKIHYPAAFETYRGTETFFPLIASVLLDEQDGVVYADDASAPRQMYVEHAFGFAQVFGHSNPAFETRLERHLLIDRTFLAPKARIYTASFPAFLADPQWDALRSFRQRFVVNDINLVANQATTSEIANDLHAVRVDENNVEQVDRLFGVVRRFWRTSEDFIHRAGAVVGVYRGQPASLCYAAAEADQRVEIDVLTLPEYRSLGIGKLMVIQFIKRCAERSVQPLWDCFSNNLASMQLCRSVGFVAPRPPYPFLTLSR